MRTTTTTNKASAARKSAETFAAISPEILWEDLSVITERVTSAPVADATDALMEFIRRGEIAQQLLDMQDNYDQ